MGQYLSKVYKRSLSSNPLLLRNILTSGISAHGIASKTKSFKEAQSTLTPVSLIICIPMFLQMLDIRPGSYLNFIPIFNHSFVLNDIFLGNINTNNILITTITSIIYSLILIYIIIKEYKSEKILFDSN